MSRARGHGGSMRTFCRLISLVLVAISLFGCGGGGGGSLLPSAAAAGTLAPNSDGASNGAAPGSQTNATVTDVKQAATVLAASQRSDGAIPYTSTMVSPYFANIAATGAARTGRNAALVQQWIGWYVARS